jgi:hypothetical protein
MFAGLIVEHREVSQLPDAAWEAYRAHGDANLLATRARSPVPAVMPTLTTALEHTRTPAERLGFADRLEDVPSWRWRGSRIDWPSRVVNRCRQVCRQR